MPTDYFELGPWALGAMLKLLLLVSAFSACVATDVIIQTGTAYQEGKFPYIADGLKVSSVEECKQKCLDSPDCSRRSQSQPQRWQGRRVSSSSCSPRLASRDSTGLPGPPGGRRAGAGGLTESSGSRPT